MLSKDSFLLTTFACALGAGVALAGDAPRPGSAADLVQQVKREKDAVKRALIVKKLEDMGKKAEKALMGSWQKVDDRTAVDLLLLIERLGTDGARDDLITATKSRKPVVRRIAASGLGLYRHKETEKALFRLVGDRDKDVYTAAIEAIQTLRSQTTYKPLLRAIRRYDNDPTSERFALLMGVARALVKETHDVEIVRDVLRMAAGEAEEHQAVFLSILDVGETKVCPPILREVLREFVYGDEYDGPGFEKPLRDAGTAESLRPISPAFAQIAIKGLGLARDKTSSEAMIAALQSPSAPVRLSALQFVHLTLPKGPQKLGEFAPDDYPANRARAIRIVMTRLTDRSPAIRKRAFLWLKRETKQRTLPISYAPWKAWYEGYFGELEGLDEEYE